MSKIKIGKYNDEQILNMFGTQKQKDSYKKNKRIATKNKATIIKNASRYCNIIYDNDSKEWIINEVYKYIIPKCFDKMNTSLYQYICPLLLDLIIRKEKSAAITVGKYARKINMVNDNYGTLKYNRVSASNYLGCDIKSIYQFYEKSDGYIDYYIKQSLKYLEEASLIKKFETVYLCEDVTSGEIEQRGNDIILNKKLMYREATKEEREFYVKCIGKADEIVNISSASERYYSEKSSMWEAELTNLLKEKNILFFYNTYEIIPTNLTKCKVAYDLFKVDNINELKIGLTKDFSKLISINAYKRVNEQFEKFKDLYNSSLECKCLYEDICNIVIDPDADDMKDIIKDRGIVFNTPKERKEYYGII